MGLAALSKLFSRPEKSKPWEFEAKEFRSQKNEAKITFSDFHYLIENEKKNILWKHMNRKIKKKLVFQLDSYILDFSEPASHKGLKADW